MGTLIITHPGSAHFDEFFAISLILATSPDTTFYIERREPSLEELDNPDIWVVDIGERLEPHLKNFDHHQDINHSASFVLVSDYLDLTRELRTLPWFDFKDKIDRFGPAKTGAELGTSRLRITYSPFEEWYLDLFAADPASSIDLMRRFGISMIKKASGMAARFKFWGKCKKVTLKNKLIVIGHTDDSTGSQEYNDTMNDPAAVLITHDSRGKGWKMCRFDNVPEVNFSKLEGNPDIKFTHKTGFVAKTHERIPLERVIELVKEALPDI
ncbi:MAG: MYG1 family protein [Proteobacteria bacterium]|nr:MYG1 family protein [Pseudomonadota bacterium]